MSLDLRPDSPHSGPPQHSATSNTARANPNHVAVGSPDIASPVSGSQNPDGAVPSAWDNYKRWLIRGGIAVALIGVIGTVVYFSQAPSASELGPQITHVIRKGNMVVSVTEQGMLESSDNTEVKCKVRGESTVIWVVESGTIVEPGDELVRLDTLQIEDAIDERTKYSHWSRSAAERSSANVRRAELAIEEYVEGRYPAQLMLLEKDLAIAQSNLRTAQNMLEHANMMYESGYLSELRLQDRTFRVRQAQLSVEVIETEIDVLQNVTREIELTTLEGDFNTAKATHAANVERAQMDEERRVQAVEELAHCVITAERGGLVIFPSAAAWEQAPDIEEGATVHRDQILLLMPDLTKMQVKVGIHESVVDQVEVGMPALVTIPDQVIQGRVLSIASVTRPAGWWTGNVVKYDTIIELPAVDGLKPGMSAEVELILSEHSDVLTIPVAAVVETEQGSFCWVKSDDGPQRRSLGLGDSNDVFIVVETGLKEGDEVILNPLAYVEEAQSEVLLPSEDESQEDNQSRESGDGAGTVDN